MSGTEGLFSVGGTGIIFGTLFGWLTAFFLWLFFENRRMNREADARHARIVALSSPVCNCADCQLRRHQSRQQRR